MEVVEYGRSIMFYFVMGWGLRRRGGEERWGGMGGKRGQEGGARHFQREKGKIGREGI